MTLRASIPPAFVLVATFAACGSPATPPGPPTVKALENFARVDDGVVRCAQPTKDGFSEAKAIGVRTVLSLRSEHDDRDLLAGTGLAYVHVPMRQWHADDEKIARALKVLTDPARRPVLVHCAEGEDRTGVVVAAYRVVYLGWDRDAAVREMKDMGTSRLWANLRSWVRSLDAERMRALVEKAEAPPVEIVR